MSFPAIEVIEQIRKQYPKGTRVELISMSDPYTYIAPGERGTVSHVDDIGTVFVRWDCGSSLGIVYGEDKIKTV